MKTRRLQGTSRTAFSNLAGASTAQERSGPLGTLESVGDDGRRQAALMETQLSEFVVVRLLG